MLSDLAPQQLGGSVQVCAAVGLHRDRGPAGSYARTLPGCISRSPAHSPHLGEHKAYVHVGHVLLGMAHPRAAYGSTLGLGLHPGPGES